MMRAPPMPTLISINGRTLSFRWARVEPPFRVKRGGPTRRRIAKRKRTLRKALEVRESSRVEFLTCPLITKPISDRYDSADRRVIAASELPP